MTKKEERLEKVLKQLENIAFSMSIGCFSCDETFNAPDSLDQEYGDPLVLPSGWTVKIETNCSGNITISYLCPKCSIKCYIGKN